MSKIEEVRKDMVTAIRPEKRNERPHCPRF